jgi:hypothetical protein
MIMSETKPADKAPSTLKLNSSRKAPSGNFDIRLVLTYATKEEVDSSYEIVKVHITSWQDRHGKSVTIITIFGAVVGVIITALTLIK